MMMMMNGSNYKLLKRKIPAVDQISDDFSDFSLSSPATKIRRLDPIVEEEDESLNVPNDERALVLFNPNLHSHSPSSFSLTLNSDLISQIKTNQLSWSKQCDYDRLRTISNDEEQNDSHLAIVPWVPQASYSSSHTVDDSEDNNNTNTTELMEDDEIVEEEQEGTMMDVEQEDIDHNVNNSSTFHHPTMLNLHHQAEGFQQHCLLAQQLPQNTSTPITWTS